MLTAVTWAFSLAYATIGLTSTRLIAGHLAWSWANRKFRIYGKPEFAQPDNEQWLGGICLGACLSVIWPLCVLPWIVSREHALGAEHRARVREQAAYIAELEQSLRM